MRLLTTEAFRGLLTAHPAPCVSLYLPLVQGARAAEHNRLRFERLLERARGDLHRFHSPRDLDPVIEPLAELAAGEWGFSRASLAAFASPRSRTHFHLCEPVQELVVVADSFHVRPLLAELQSNRHYFLLTLSRREARFYRGSRTGLVPVEVAGSPSLVEVAREPRERVSTRHSGGAGWGATIRHGWSGGDGVEEEETRRMLREVDRILRRELAFEKAPLVLAAPTELHAAFRTIARYAHLAEGALHGNFDAAHPAELHEKAWPIVREELGTRETRSLDDFRSLAAHGRASTDVSEIARSAVQGRVRELFLAAGEHVWGAFDRETGAVQIAPGDARLAGDDVLDDVAEAVLSRGGEVLALERSRMPAEAQAAALMRW